jgi:hypothetical protein
MGKWTVKLFWKVRWHYWQTNSFLIYPRYRVGTFVAALAAAAKKHDDVNKLL